MKIDFTTLIKRLSESPGPSGQEEAVNGLIVKEIQPICQRLEEDSFGNLIATVGAESGYRIGVLAHMDEVGLIVSNISEKGLIYFELVGSIDARSLLGCEVDIISEDKKLIRGIIGNESRHLQSVESMTKPTTHKELWIDVGANSRDEVLIQKINVGCGMVFATKFTAKSNGIIFGKALDDRIGCAVLIETLRYFHAKLQNTTLYGMFTCQEEIGAKGARVVAFDKRPQLTITLDTVPTKNPDKIKSEDVDLNRGAVIRLFDWVPSLKYGMFTHPAIRERLLDLAVKNNIRFKTDVLTSTFLDSSQVHLTAGGIPGGSICFPRRYSHSAIEASHLNDVESGFNLLVAFIKSIDENPIAFGKIYPVVS